MVFFQVLGFLTCVVEQFLQFLQVYMRNFKKNITVLLLSSTLNCSIAHYWWLTHERCFTVNNRDCCGFQYQEKVEKVEKHSEGGLLVQISLLKLMMKTESLYEKTRSVVNISSEYTSLQKLDRRQVWNFWHFSAHKFNTYIDLLLTF